MPAPNQTVLYAIEPALTKAVRQHLQQRLGASFFEPMEQAVIDNEEGFWLNATLGAATGQYHLFPNGKYEYSVFEYTLTINVATLRSTEHKDHSLQISSNHLRRIAQIRQNLGVQNGGDAITALLPYHAIATMMPQGAQHETDEGHDITELTYSGTIAIREDAWPAL